MGRGIYKIRNIALVIMILVVPFAYTAQGMNSFLFGNSAVGVSEGTQVYADEQAINENLAAAICWLPFIQIHQLLQKGNV